MTPEHVLKEIETKEVREAFQRAILISLPKGVLEKYEFEDGEYTKYSDHTQGQIAKGRAEGLAKGEAIGAFNERRVMVQRLLSKNKSDDDIMDLLDITADELMDIKASLTIISD